MTAPVLPLAHLDHLVQEMESVSEELVCHNNLIQTLCRVSFESSVSDGDKENLCHIIFRCSGDILSIISNLQDKISALRELQ